MNAVDRVRELKRLRHELSVLIRLVGESHRLCVSVQFPSGLRRWTRVATKRDEQARRVRALADELL